MKNIKQGSIQEMLFIAFPIMISFACDTVMTFTDRLFLSRLSEAHMNAAMAGGITVFMSMTFFLGLIGYVTALVAQHLGAGYKKQCPRIVSQGVIISILAYPLILMLRPVILTLFEHINIAPDQLLLQKEYFNVLIFSVIIGLLRSCFSSFFSGIGRSKIVMISSLAAMVTNIFANYIFIFGKLGCPSLGIKGAAIGTIIGGLVGLVVFLIKYFSSNIFKEFDVLHSFVFDKSLMMKLLKFGYPAGLEMWLGLFAFTILTLVFHSRGIVTATAATIVFNWDMVSFVPLLGVEIAVTSLVGRYMGAKRPDVVNHVVFSGLKISWVYSAVIFIMFLLFTKQLVSVFKPVEYSRVFFEAFPTSIFMLRMASLYVLVTGVMIVFSGALRGAGDTFWAMSISVVIHWTLTLVLILMLKVFGVSTEMAWTVVVLVFMMLSSLLYFRYRSGNWKKIHVLDDNDALATVHDDFHEQGDL